MNSTEPMKTVVVVRKDLELPTGKWIAQAVHAVLRTPLNAEHLEYHNEEPLLPICVVCYVKKESELFKLQDKCKEVGVPCAIQVDAGHNFVVPGTPTCMSIGPGPKSAVDSITKRLQLYK